MGRWVVLWVAACAPIDSSTRAGIQIGQESGGCEPATTTVASDWRSPDGMTADEAVPDGAMLAMLSFEGGGETSLELEATLISSQWVALEPLNPDATFDCEPPGWLENTVALSLRSADGQLDELVPVTGRVFVVDDDLLTDLGAWVDAGDVQGSLDLGEALRLRIEGSLMASGHSDGAIRAEEPGGAVRTVATWASTP